MMPTWTSRIKGHDSSEPPPKKARLSAAERRELEHKEAVRQVERMLDLVREVRKELDEKQQHVLSIKALERLEEIQKLSREARGRLRR